MPGAGPLVDIYCKTNKVFSVLIDDGHSQDDSVTNELMQKKNERACAIGFAYKCTYDSSDPFRFTLQCQARCKGVSERSELTPYNIIIMKTNDTVHV